MFSEIAMLIFLLFENEMNEIPIISSILKYRNKSIQESTKETQYTSFQAYSAAAIVVLVITFFYCVIKKQDIRYSTLLTIGAVSFLVTMMILDSPEQKFYRLIAALVIALIIFEIVGYEIMRVLRDRNRAVTIENLIHKYVEGK